MLMQTVDRSEMLRKAVDRWRTDGQSIALVPTMGALHKGHLTLMREALKRADRVVASIFVNPKQFGPNEDLDAYPRRLAEDARALEAEGVDLLWAPSADIAYPPGFATTIRVEGVAAHFCGATRPGHFEGVATIVCKLFNQVRPDIAVFGEKDFQQLAVIRRMTRDLDLSFPSADAIVGVPTVREADGLAMSSRNQYLGAEDRIRAAALPRAMREAIEEIESGSAAASELGRLQSVLLEAGFSSVDYAALADPETLQPLEAADRPARLLVAARIGGTRLIDNMPVMPVERS